MKCPCCDEEMYLVDPSKGPLNEYGLFEKFWFCPCSMVIDFEEEKGFNKKMDALKKFIEQRMKFFDNMLADELDDGERNEILMEQNIYHLASIQLGMICSCLSSCKKSCKGSCGCKKCHEDYKKEEQDA